MIKKIFTVLTFLFFLTFSNCSSLKTHVDFYNGIIADFKTEKYSLAVTKIEEAKNNQKYLKKDMVLYYLDKGAILHYLGDFAKSNNLLETADQTMEELFTKSISKAITSIILNDNVLDYCGEIHDNLYVNLFKALNYLRLDKFDDSYVEIKRVNDKLRELDDKYGKFIEEMNKSVNAKIKINKKDLKFYDDVIAHYLSYLIFRAKGEHDNSRISHEKLKKAWRLQPHVYDFSMPDCLKYEPNYRGQFLNVIAFTGNAPIKYPIGGQITTYNGYIHVSDLSYSKKNVVMQFSGIKQGYHFKFAFPEIRSAASIINRIEVYIDNRKAGELELLEDIGKVATTTFERKKYIIYIKTIIRTILKGVESEKAKEKARKEVNSKNKVTKFLLDKLINIGVDVIVDATENPDLRCWRTLPQKCYIGEFCLNPGYYNIDLYFYSQNGLLIKEKKFKQYEINNGLNLIEAICLY